MSLWDHRLGDVLADTASSRPTPGGGSVAAVCGALGAGLVAMALEISRGKATPEAGARIDQVLDATKQLLVALRDHADRDVAVFEGYLQALALPRTTEEDQATRQAARSAAAVAATEAPLACAADLVAVLALAEAAGAVARSQVLSDVAAGADLLIGALHAVLRNVDINLPSIAADELRDRLGRRRAEVARQGEEVYHRVASAVALRA